MNTSRDTVMSDLMQSWFERIINIEQVNVTQVAEINELYAKVTVLEDFVAGDFKVSILGIDADKDWSNFALTNVKSIAVNNNITVGGTVDGVDIAGSIDQAVKTTSTPRFTAVNIGADCQISRAGANLLYTPDEFQLDAKLYANGQAQVGGLLSVFSVLTTGQIATLQITRGAMNSSWNHRLMFTPYGALADGNPAWYLMGGDDVNTLILKHYNGSVASPVMTFGLDKSVTIHQIAKIANLYAQNYPFKIVASANVRNSHDAEKSFVWATAYSKQKTITMTNGLGSGTVRCTWEGKATVAGGTCYARVYKNGVAVGAVKTWSTGTYTVFSDDISISCEPGDTIELWAYQNGGNGNGGYLKNFRLCYDMSLDPSMPSANS